MTETGGSSTACVAYVRIAERTETPLTTGIIVTICSLPGWAVAVAVIFYSNLPLPARLSIGITASLFLLLLLWAFVHGSRKAQKENQEIRGGVWSDPESPAPDLALSQALYATGWRRLSSRTIGVRMPRDWPTLAAVLGQSGRAGAVRCIVDHRLRAQCEKIPIIADLVEPEPIRIAGSTSVADPGKELRRRRMGVVIRVLWPIAFIGIAWILFSNFGWPKIAFWLVSALAIGCAFLPNFMLVRDPIFASPPVAGLGVIRDGKGRLWTCTESIMFVEPYYVPKAGSGVQVDLFGPQGTRKMHKIQFPSCLDDGFVSLWQRWNHPHPRPELGA